MFEWPQSDNVWVCEVIDVPHTDINLYDCLFLTKTLTLSTFDGRPTTTLESTSTSVPTCVGLRLLGENYNATHFLSRLSDLSSRLKGPALSPCPVLCCYSMLNSRYRPLLGMSMEINRQKVNITFSWLLAACFQTDRQNLAEITHRRVRNRQFQRTNASTCPR